MIPDASHSLDYYFHMRFVRKVPSRVVWKIETFIEEDIQDTKNIVHRTMTPQSPSKQATLGPHIVLPITISYPVVFSWISSMIWNLFPFKSDFSFGKSRKLQGTKSRLQGGWVTWMIWYFTKNSAPAQDVMHEWGRCGDEAANHLLATVAAFWITWIVSTEECSSLM